MLITALSQGLLREDAGLDVYQMLEASVRQFSEWGHTDAGRHSGCRRAPSRATWQPDDRELRMPTLPNHIEVGFLRRQGLPSERQLLYRG